MALQAIATGINAFATIFDALSVKRKADADALSLQAEGESIVDDAVRKSFAIQRAGERLKGAQAASTAARGVAVGTGSSLELATEAFVNINLQAADRVRVAQVQKDVLRRRGKQIKRAGRGDLVSGIVRGGGNIIESALELNA